MNNPLPNKPLPSLLNRLALTRLIEIANTSPAGNFVEIGVYKGGSAWHLTELAKTQNRQIYLYDTFEGIPYRSKIDHHNIGDFNDTNYINVKESLPYAHVVKGIFPESALDMENISFVHFDCDQYQSIIDGVNYILPKMVSGGIMLFDDYNWLEGATKAVNELFGKETLLSVGAPHANKLDRVYKII